MYTQDAIELATDTLRDIDKLHTLSKRVRNAARQLEVMYADLSDVTRGGRKFCTVDGCLKVSDQYNGQDTCIKHWSGDND